MYLLFDNLSDAEERADEEGKLRNYSYWTEGCCTRWLTAPFETADGKYALDVSEYSLSPIEYDSIHETVEMPEIIDELQEDEYDPAQEI